MKARDNLTITVVVKWSFVGLSTISSDKFLKVLVEHREDSSIITRIATQKKNISAVFRTIVDETMERSLRCPTVSEVPRSPIYSLSQSSFLFFLLIGTDLKRRPSCFVQFHSRTFMCTYRFLQKKLMKLQLELHRSSEKAAIMLVSALLLLFF